MHYNLLWIIIGWLAFIAVLALMVIKRGTIEKR